jgi:hypothetical protein
MNGFKKNNKTKDTNDKTLTGSKAIEFLKKNKGAL